MSIVSTESSFPESLHIWLFGVTGLMLSMVGILATCTVANSWPMAPLNILIGLTVTAALAAMMALIGKLIVDENRDARANPRPDLSVWRDLERRLNES